MGKQFSATGTTLKIYIETFCFRIALDRKFRMPDNSEDLHNNICPPSICTRPEMQDTWHTWPVHRTVRCSYLPSDTLWEGCLRPGNVALGIHKGIYRPVLFLALLLLARLRQFLAFLLLARLRQFLALLLLARLRQFLAFLLLVRLRQFLAFLLLARLRQQKPM